MAPPSTQRPAAPEGLDLDLEDEPEGERPTLVPPFDVEAFARDSEMRQRAVVAPTEDLTLHQARSLLSTGDPEKALFLLARLLEQSPFNTEARVLSKECSDALEQECWAEIGPRSATFAVAVSPEALKAFGLDHVSGFLLSLMDGVSDVETLLDLCAFPRLLALRHLRSLVTRGIVMRATRPHR